MMPLTLQLRRKKPALKICDNPRFPERFRNKPDERWLAQPLGCTSAAHRLRST